MSLFRISKPRSQTKSKTVLIKDIGEINYVVSTKARRVNISVRPHKGIRVAVPKRVSFEEAELFVHQKKDWLKEAVKKIQKHENAVTFFDATTEFRTKHHELKIRPEDLSKIKVTIRNGIILVCYPLQIEVKHERIQKAVRMGIERAWLREAQVYLPERVEFYARKFQLNYSRVRIKNTKTRWGSCSYQNNINLTLHLMRLPEHLIDYVILHELAHTVVKNHGKQFWLLLQKLTGNAKGLAREMKNYKISIY
jgi:predicted metal-dependent hydrolase